VVLVYGSQVDWSSSASAFANDFRFSGTLPAANKTNLSVQVGKHGGGAPGKKINGRSRSWDPLFQLAESALLSGHPAAGRFRRVLPWTFFRQLKREPPPARLRVGNDTFNLSGVGVGVALSLVYDVVRGSDASSVLPLQTIPFPDTPLTNKATLSGSREETPAPRSAKITDAAILGASFSLADTPFFSR